MNYNEIEEFIINTEFNTIKETKEIKNQGFIEYNTLLNNKDIEFLIDIENKYFKKRFFKYIFRKIFSEKIKIRVIYKCDICGKEEEREITSISVLI